ncbi:MAG: tandem-95 repeat protein, partial [Pedobacter sp.]
DGTIQSYQWTQVSGPNTATITNDDQATTNVSGLVQGVYTFRLTVRDNDNAAGTETVNVTVNPAPLPANVLPVANAGANITITLPTNTATLNGTLSDDADGNIASYQWVQVAGPNTATITNGTQVRPVVTGLVEGVYTFRLTVRDNRGGTNADAVNVTVNPAPVPANQLPVASAGNNITITLPTNTATLNGTQSSDADGTIASYQWTQVAGPNTATITNGGLTRPVVSGLIQGVYTFRLTVRDNRGGTSSDAVNVTVNAAAVPVNQLPVANAGTNITITLPINSATLNGTQSNDPDGNIASYLWTQVAGPNTATITNGGLTRPVVSGLVQGVYTFRLTIRDDNGATASDAVNVTVNAAAVPVNQLPVANAGTNITITLPTNSATLNGTQSNDPDGNIASYQWTQVSGPNTATITNGGLTRPVVSGLIQGVYTFRITIRDDNGATASDVVTVTVNPAAAPVNQAPVANAGADINITLPANNTAINGSLSDDADGTIASYQWTQVSGPNTATITGGNQSRPTVSGLIEGVYTFRLTVRDNDGASDSDAMTVTVNKRPNTAPTADAGANITISIPTSTATLDGTDSKDADGSIVSYQWVQLSGPNTSTITNGNQATASATQLVAGTYTFRLTVRDNDGASATATVTVTVRAVANKAPIANAGISQATTLLTNEANLNGSLSRDPDGVIVSYRWEQISGPSNATISTPGLATSKVTGFSEGDYIFQLTVRDNSNAIARDTVTIAVVNNFRSFTNDLMLYPNPATDQINLVLYNERFKKAGVTVYDVTGRKVMAPFEINNIQNRFSTVIDVQGLKPGTYIIEVIMDNRQKVTTKFVKQ